MLPPANMPLHPSFRPLAFLATAWILVTMATGLDVRAQSTGTVLRTSWPDVLYETQADAMNRPRVAAAENFSDVAVLPFVDTLALAYDATTLSTDAGPVPSLRFELSWVSASWGILDGRVVDALPDSVTLTLIDLHADVVSGGIKVADLVLALDSLWLPDGAFYYEFEAQPAGWDDVFRDASALVTQQAFTEGFTLENLEILRVEFEAPPPAPEVEREVLVVQRPPRRRSIFVPDSGIWIGWNIGRDPYYRAPRTRAGASRPRGETGRVTESGDPRRPRGGRTASTADDAQTGSTSTGSERDAPQSSGEATRSSSRGRGLLGKADNKDDDNDKDRDFLGPALGAAAAVGALAYFGGTIGYFGYPSEAPVGLQAGRITASGGFMMHAAVNSDVVSGGGNERLVAGFSGVFRPIARGIHPMAGLDVWFSELGDSAQATPHVTAGIMVRRGAVSAQLGARLADVSPRIGLAFSFR